MFQVLRRRLTKVLTNFYDPLVNISIGEKTIKIPLSHQLREIVGVYPQYNFNLARIVGIVNEQIPNVRIVDIGANVGDTVAYIKSKADVPILCIDGEKRYVKLLRDNAEKFRNVFICETLVGATNVNTNMALKVNKGTAYLEKSEHSSAMRTLDNIFDEYPDFRQSKLIKSDTDGFDSIIMRSCEEHLRNYGPMLFLEFDPHLMKKNGDDAFSFVNYLESCGYKHFIFYTNIGDFLASCSSDQPELLNQLIHYFSGRKLDLFADLCAFKDQDKMLFDEICNRELSHFKNVRGY